MLGYTFIFLLILLLFFFAFPTNNISLETTLVQNYDGPCDQVTDSQGHTSYLSQAPQAVPVEKKSAMWRNFLFMTDVMWRYLPHDILSGLHLVSTGKNLSCGEMWRQIWHVEKFLHMRNVEANLFCHNSCCSVAKSGLLPFTLFCRKIYFVAIYALLCGEQLNQNLCLWRKKDKYEVCTGVKCRGR